MKMINKGIKFLILMLTFFCLTGDVFAYCEGKPPPNNPNCSLSAYSFSCYGMANPSDSSVYVNMLFTLDNGILWSMSQP